MKKETIDPAGKTMANDFRDAVIEQAILSSERKSNDTIKETAAAPTVSVQNQSTHVTPQSPAPNRTLSSTSELILGEKLGEGGMGTVFQATQKEMQRQVAVKELQPTLGAIDRIKQSFVTEAVVTGKLAHPNIVPVYGLGKTPDSLCMSMKLVSGCTLENILRPQTGEHRILSCGLDLDDRIEILIAICNPVAFAHSREIIHRDIKPDNIMTGEFGEILLLDWGLASSITEDPLHISVEGMPHVTQLTGPEGTWSYMAPEMMDGDGAALGVHSDIYLLGACLYDIVAGESPHRHRLERLFKTTEERDYCKPLPANVDAEIRHICAKAMASNPKKRYASVLDFQRDLKDYLKHQQSRQIAKQAERQFAAAKSMSPGKVNDASRISLFYNLANALSLFRQSLVLWDANQQAKEAFQKDSLEAAKIMIQSGEYNSALVYLKDVEGQQADTLRQKVTAAVHNIRKARRAMVYLRFAGIVFAGLLVASAVSAWLVYHFMETTADRLSMEVRATLVSNGQQALQRIVSNVATNIKLQQHTIGVALDHFADSFELAYAATEGATAKEQERMEASELLDFVYSRRHAKNIDAANSPSLVTFDGFVFHQPSFAPIVDTYREKMALQRIAPEIKRLYMRNRNLLVRYFMAFADSHLSANYPGSRDKPADYDPVLRDWFKIGAAVDNVIFTRPYRDVTTNRVLVSAVRAVRKSNGELHGVAGIDLYMSDLQRQLKVNPRWADEFKIEIARIDGDELDILFSTTYEKMNRNATWQTAVPRTRISHIQKKAVAVMRDTLAENKEGVVTLKQNGQSVFWGYAPLGINDSFVLLTVDYKTLTRDADRIQNTIVQENTETLIFAGKMVGLIFATLLLFSLVLTVSAVRRKLARKAML
ncbi:MAG: protein kinase [Deltaproteobacteria bacterium]|nr:protein kinase [Deltaproteobacteria bacterium]